MTNKEDRAQAVEKIQHYIKNHPSI